MTAIVPAKLHAELGASNAGRWMACPGSTQMSRQVPAPPTSDAAEEGTAAHELAELTLKHPTRDTADYIGVTLNGYEVTEEMADHVRVFTDHCRGLVGCIGGGAEAWVERKFSLAELAPPGPMFGTADYVAYDPANRTLHVVDLKYGQGVVVEAVGNRQLRYYGLGALLSMPKGTPIDRVVMTIVQPRAAHPDGMVRTDEISTPDLVAFAAELLEAARATTRPDAPLAAGPHCRFCPARGVCPEQMRLAQEAAQLDFAALPGDVPPAPAILPPDLFAELLPKLGILEDWIRAMRAHAAAKLQAGDEVPGYKLVETRPTRRWVDDAGTRQWLEAKGYAETEYLKQELRSPAQIEKLVGKKALPTEMWVKQSSGLKMVPTSDPSPAVSVTRGEEFLPLMAGD